MDNGQSHIETNERMHPFVMGRSFWALVATILFCMLAFNLLKKKKRAPTLIGEGNDYYDVFLSFRGLDTRKGFTDHLYHNLDKVGIVPTFVFRDDKSIPIGEEFGPRILGAITRSKISIPIISKNYASSKWCLRELIHIMDRVKKTSHIVLPIFYKVNPSDVRHLKGSFGKAFHSSKKYFDEEDIQKGQQALKEVSDLHGWESEKVANGHEGELIERVVETIIRKLQEDFQLDVPPQLVGLDGPMKEIMNWIHSPSINARMIGIYGMGGIGKTTLAKCIYNQLFNKFMNVSFLRDVRETIRQNGITHLQSQLISDLLLSKWQVSRIDDGIKIIKSRFRGKKVLIILDDIDEKNQLDALARERDWFMAGSLIIVTTRNEAVLDQSEFKVDYKYKLNELETMCALLLFNKHAFRKDHSPRDFEGISRDIICPMGGLPLALQVVGSYLYNKNRKVWADVKKKLKKQPHRDVKKILQISFDALEDEQKQIFLDIVCYFIGETSKYAMYMWEDCGFYPNQGIEELKLRCLIKIGDDGKFMVHDQLRDLGRSIFCQGQPLEKHSGPWDDDYEGVPRVLKHLERHPRFYDFLGAASSGHSKQLLSEVRWLQWKVIESDASLSTVNLHLPKLSVLVLWKSKITEDWEGWSSFMASKQLKVLDLSKCLGLRRTPDLSAFTQLKRIILFDCHELKHLHHSIGKLTSLVHLNLSFCGSLKQLPEEVGKLKDLEELLLNSSGITEIPSSIGDLQNLQRLNLSSSGIKKLPSAIGRLKNLRTLHLSSCHSLKGAIPSEIGDLPSLETLDLTHTQISDLPESVGNLSSLQCLDLSHCRSLREIPSSIGDLQNLQHLNLSSSRITKLPSAIGRLKNLRTLHLSCCHNLKEAIPSEIGDLSSLEILDLYGTPISDLPESVQNLSYLQRLNLWGRKELQSLPKLPSGLKGLQVVCQSLGLPQHFSLTHLEELDLKVCHLHEDIRELSSIPSKLCFEEWDKLTSLRLSRLMHLEELSIKKCSSLKVISLWDCNSIERLRCLELPCLKELNAIRCGNLVKIEGPDGAEFLEKLDLWGCKSMATWRDLTGWEKLQSLKVRDCKKLTQFQGLEMLNLMDLNIMGCDSLEAIPKLSRTRILRD